MNNCAYSQKEQHIRESYLAKHAFVSATQKKLSCNHFKLGLHVISFFIQGKAQTAKILLTGKLFPSETNLALVE